MLRIKFTYFDLLNPSNPLNGDYYFAPEALDYNNIYWEPRITDSFDIERFFDIQSDTSNRIRTVQIHLDNHDSFFNQFMTSNTTLLNNLMTLYYDNGNGVTKSFTGRVQSVDSVSSTVSLTLREIGYEYLENTFPDAQIAYDYYSDNGINDSWNCIPIHFGTVNRIPLSWVNSFYSEYMIGSGPILRVNKVYIDDDVVYDRTNPNIHYKPNEDSNEIHVRIFRGIGWDADGKRETVVDTVRPETLDPIRETVNGNNVTHISQWGGFAYIQLYSIDDNNYEIPAYPYNSDGAIGQVYVDIEGIVSVTKSGNTYTYGTSTVRNPASIIKMMFCNPQLVSEGPCAIGWGYKESDVDFSQAITDCNNLGFKIDGSFDSSGQFVESLKIILQCCRGYIIEENEKITLHIDKAKDSLNPSAEFDEEGITGYDCNLEEWNEPDLDSQTNRIRLNYDWSQEFKRYNKKPDVNHESPDYEQNTNYDQWLIDPDHNLKIQKWNTEELELKLVSDTTTAHKLAIYYLRKKCLQHVQGTLSCENSVAMNLDAGDLITIKSRQFNWHNPSNLDAGKLFQITSIKKGNELTDIEFIEYDPNVFIMDSSTFNMKTLPSKIANKLLPVTPTNLVITQSVKEYADTSVIEVAGVITYASNSNKLYTTVQYADCGTTNPDSSYVPTWITYANINDNKFTISGLTPGHYYKFRVYTVNANGASQPRTSSTILMQGDTVAPAVPTITNPNISGKSITIKISLSSAPVDFKGFELYKDGNYVTSITVNRVNGNASTEYTDLCEEYDTNYKYKARSFDKWNNVSSFTSEITVHTPEAVDIEDIASTIAQLQDDMVDTNTRITNYVSDDVLSIGEKARLAKDWLSIRDSRYTKVKTEAENHFFNTALSAYNADYLAFVAAYNALKDYVDGAGSVVQLTVTPLTELNLTGIGSTVTKKFSDYYDMEIKVLSDIDKDNKNRASTIYAECYTEANVASKWVILPDVVIFTGLRLCVKFFNGNTSLSVITLNIKRNVSDESGLITGGKLYHNSGYAIPVITFEAGTTITLVLTEKTEIIDGVSTIVQAWEFSDSSILGLGEQELSLGNKTFNLGMVNGNRILAETVDTQQLNAQAVTSEKITSEQIFGKDFRTSEDVGETVDNTIIAGIKFNANGIFGYNTLYQSIAINASDGSVRLGSDSVYMSFNQADGLKVVGNISGSSGIIGDVVLDSNGLHSNTIDSNTQQTIYSLGNTGLIARRGNIAGWTITDTSLEASGIHLRSNGLIYGGNYASGVSGWRIDQLGNAEFNSATIRGKIQTAVFEYNKVSAIGGQMLIKRASIVVSDSTHVNTATTLYVKDANEFSVGDCFFVKDPEQVTGGMFYGIISAVDTTNNVLTYSIPDDAGAFFSPANGQSVVNYGNPMSGGIMFDGNSPYIDIFKNHEIKPIIEFSALNCTTTSIAQTDGVIDISGNNNNGQAYGGVEVFYDEDMGNCFKFDGTQTSNGQTLSIPINFDWSNDFTIIFKLYPTSYTNDPCFIDARPTTNDCNFFVAIDNKRIRFVTKIDASNTNTYRSTASLNENELYCIIINYKSETNKLKLYINETLDSEQTIQTNFKTGYNITVGNFYNNNPSRNLGGMISDFQIYDVALNAEQIAELYTKLQEPKKIGVNVYNPILNIDLTNSTTDSIAETNGVKDVSGNNIHGQAYGGVAVVQDAEMCDCFSFDGTDDYIIVNKSSGILTNANKFTFSFRMKILHETIGNYWIGSLSGGTDYPSSQRVLRIYLTSSDNLLHFSVIGTTNSDIGNIGIEVTESMLNSFVLYSFVFDNSVNKASLFINGVLKTSIDTTQATIYSTPKTLCIGKPWETYTSSYIHAEIADLRIYQRALSASEISTLYQQISDQTDNYTSKDPVPSFREFSGGAIQLDHLVRLGNLNGIADITDDRYGIFLGDDESYLSYDNKNGLRLINNNFATDGSILSTNFLWIDGNGNVHDDINMEIASDVDKGITNGQRYTEDGSMLNMTSGAFVTPKVRFDNSGSFYTKSKAFFENPDNISTFFDVKYTTIESRGNLVLYDYQDNYSDSKPSYQEGPGAIAMFTLGEKNPTTGLRTLSGIKLNGSLNSYQSFPSMMTLARTTSTTVDDNGNVSSYTTNKSSTVSHPYWLPVIQMSNLIYDNTTDKTDLYVDASVYPTALTGSNKTLNLGSPSYRWSTFYSNYGSFGNDSGTPNSSKVEIGTDVSYGRGIRIYAGSQAKSGILFGGNDLTSNSGTSANSYYLTNESGTLKIYNNTTVKFTYNTNGTLNSTGTSGTSSVDGKPAFESALTSSTYKSAYNGCVIINSTAAKGFTMLARMKSTNGKFMHGVYNDNYQFYYVADNVTTNSVTKTCLTINENGTVSAPNGFVGALTGNADTATTATNAVNVKRVNKVNDKISILGVPSGTSANENGATCALTASNATLQDYSAESTAQRYTILSLGNATAVGTSGNRAGAIHLYGTGTNSLNIDGGNIRTSNGIAIDSSLTEKRTYTLPDATGTIALTSSDITGNAATATSATKVVQTVTTLNDNRPLLCAYITGTSTTSDVTNSVLYVNSVYVHPSTGLLTATGGFLGQLHSTNTSQVTTYETTGAKGYSMQLLSYIKNNTTGLFPTTNNANAILRINRYKTDGQYNSELGFSSDGNLYYRKFDAAVPDTSTAWKKIAFTDSDITGTATNANKVKRKFVGGSWLSVLGVPNDTAEDGYGETGTISDSNFIFQNRNSDSTETRYSAIGLGNNIATGTSGNRAAELLLYGTGSAYLSFRMGTTNGTGRIITINSNLSQGRTYTLPNKNGTLALTDDIPTAGHTWNTTKAKTTDTATSTHPNVVVKTYETTQSLTAAQGGGSAWTARKGYRKWSDGFKEEWGIWYTGTAYTLLCGGFSDTNYTVIASPKYYNNNVTHIKPASKTQISSDGGPSIVVAYEFYCCGY